MAQDGDEQDRADVAKLSAVLEEMISRRWSGLTPEKILEKKKQLIADMRHMSVTAADGMRRRIAAQELIADMRLWSDSARETFFDDLRAAFCLDCGRQRTSERCACEWDE